MVAYRGCAKTCLFALAFVVATAFADSTRASPPLSASGLDLPLLISLWDRTRRMSHRLEHDWHEWWRDATASARTEASDADGSAVSTSESTEETGRIRPRELDSIQTIVLDAGHGGDNSGGRGVADVEEKRLTIELAYALRRQLQQRYPDLRVVMTRYWDTSMALHDRTHLANRVEADLLLSLHYNAAPHDRAVGVETYFLPTRQVVPGRKRVKGKRIATMSPRVTGMQREREREPVGIQNDELAVIRRDLARAREHKYSGRLAQIVQTNLLDHLDTIDRGVKQRNFGVLRGAMMPAVIVEAGFLTHPKEGRRLLTEQHRSKVVDGLIDAVRRFDDLRTRARSGAESTADQESTGQ